MKGHYIFGDQYNGLKKTSGPDFNSVYDVSWKCAGSSPLKCNDNIGEIYTFGEGSSGNLLIGSSSGIYEVVDQSECNLECNEEESSASTLSHSIIQFLAVIMGLALTQWR